MISYRSRAPTKKCQLIACICRMKWKDKLVTFQADLSELRKFAQVRINVSPLEVPWFWVSKSIQEGQKYHFPAEHSNSLASFRLHHQKGTQQVLFWPTISQKAWVRPQHGRPALSFRSNHLAAAYSLCWADWEKEWKRPLGGKTTLKIIEIIWDWLSE